MLLYEVISGGIVSNVTYQVVSGTSGITYNSVGYGIGDFFVGVGVTTYTKIFGDEFVTIASIFLGIDLGVENDFFVGLYNDSSKFLGISLGIEGNKNKSQIIRISYR